MESLTLSNLHITGGFATLQGDLPVFTSADWESHIQAWIDAEREVTDVRWRQAAIAYSLDTHYGDTGVVDFARQIGISPRRVWEYRAVYDIVKNCERPHNLDFTHYVIASSADNPHEYLEKAAEESLSTRALKRLIRQDTTPPIEAELPAISENPAVVRAWDTVRRALADLKAAAPALGDLIDSALDDLQYEISLPPGSVKGAMLDAIRRGYDDLDAIAHHLKKNRDHVLVWLNRLEELGEVERHEAERAPGARGPARTFYTLAVT